MIVVCYHFDLTIKTDTNLVARYVGTDNYWDKLTHDIVDTMNKRIGSYQVFKDLLEHNDIVKSLRRMET